MRFIPRLLAGGIACGLVLSCHPRPGVPAPDSGGPPTLRRQMAALSFLSYVGDSLKGSDDDVERQLAECMPAALAAQVDARAWKLAWGPAVYRFFSTALDDNMMYVVRQPTTPPQIAIVVRGTNPRAFLDWLVEDFDVINQVSWPYGSPPGEPKISKGTSEGLHILQGMTPAGSPQQTLTEFLAEKVKAAPTGLRVYVTGHSLGGALAPALALWLADTQATWDPAHRAQIGVYTLAGPTSGNADFAAYYDATIQATARLWNPYDVVPLAWDPESMERMDDLYEPLTRADAVERGLIGDLRSRVKDKGYTQIEAAEPALSGALFTGQTGEKVSWASEAGWQHHCGYQCALGVFVDPSTTRCPSKPLPRPCTPELCPRPRR